MNVPNVLPKESLSPEGLVMPVSIFPRRSSIIIPRTQDGVTFVRACVSFSIWPCLPLSQNHLCTARKQEKMGDAQGKMWLIESFLPSGRKTKLKGPRESFRASEVKKIWKERARENEKERERERVRERERDRCVASNLQQKQLFLGRVMDMSQCVLNPIHHLNIN